MPSPQAPELSDTAIEKAARALFADVIRVVAPAIDDDGVTRRWSKTPPATQEHYRVRAENVLTAAHDEIAGPAWAEGHDDGQANLTSEGMIARGVRARIENPYPYTLVSE